MKLRMRRSLMLLVILVSAIMIGGCGDAKIGVVDVNKIMTDSPKVQQLQEQLQTSAKTLMDQLEADKPNLSPEDLQKRSAGIKEEIAKTNQELSGQLNTMMDQTLGEVAKEKGLAAILYKNTVAQGGIDITDDVIKKMQ